MAPDSKPDVEVATIKPTRPGNVKTAFGMQGGTLVIKGLTVGFLMSFAYDLSARQIAGKPGWMDTDKWDIEAKPDTPGMPNESQVRVILQKVFTERFGLQVHEEKRKVAAYVLIVSKDGTKNDKGCRRVDIAKLVGILRARERTPDARRPYDARFPPATARRGGKCQRLPAP